MIDQKDEELRNVELRCVKEIKTGDVIRPPYWNEYHKVLWTHWRDSTFKVLDMQLEGVNHVCTFCFYDEVWTPCKR